MPRTWSAPERPALYAEQALLAAILDGTYSPGVALPGERDLAARLGVTRPTLREVLQRLGRDGWLVIRHGKPTIVNDYWRWGGLNVLTALVRQSPALPDGFILHLLEMRLALAPAYTAAAVARSSDDVITCLGGYAEVEDSPMALADFDWHVQHGLTVASRNPVYTLVLNGFAGFYTEMACLYFAVPAARAASKAFYAVLLAAARAGDAVAAEHVTREVMQESMVLWQQASSAREG